MMLGLLELDAKPWLRNCLRGDNRAGSAVHLLRTSSAELHLHRTAMDRTHISQLAIVNASKPKWKSWTSWSEPLQVLGETSGWFIRSAQPYPGR